MVRLRNEIDSEIQSLPFCDIDFCITLPELCLGSGEEWEEGQTVSGVKYKAEDGTERVALAHLSIVCDGMYSNLRKSLANHEVKSR